MYAIIGATGKVGFSTASVLRQAGLPVRAIVRDAAKSARLIGIGCEIAVANLRNAAELANAIGNAANVQIILPPDPQARDVDVQMRGVIESLTQALEQVRPACVLAISDYGAHITHDIGMPSVFRFFEERLRALRGQKLIVRSAEHMQGWGRVISVAVASGTLPSFHDPLDKAFPTISAPDLGRIAADLWMQPASGKDVEIFHAEGPRRYSAYDVASALSLLLGRPVEARAVPRSHWQETFERIMDASLAGLLIKANDAQNEGLVDVEPAGAICRGTTELIDALRPLTARR